MNPHPARIRHIDPATMEILEKDMAECLQVIAAAEPFELVLPVQADKLHGLPDAVLALIATHTARGSQHYVDLIQVMVDHGHTKAATCLGAEVARVCMDPKPIAWMDPSPFKSTPTAEQVEQWKQDEMFM